MAVFFKPFLTLLLLSVLPGNTFIFGEISPKKIVIAARAQIGVTLSYDPAYRRLDYPGGDVPQKTGVCTDVVIRALRHQGLDLQKEVFEDMRQNFSQYPKNWGNTKPDRNIDHRRVPNLMTWLARRGVNAPIHTDSKKYLPGDLVAWDLGSGQTHIGVVSDKKTPAGVPFIIHNICCGVQEEDLLFRFKIIGHYRLASPS